MQRVRESIPLIKGVIESCSEMKGNYSVVSKELSSTVGLQLIRKVNNTTLYTMCFMYMYIEL